MIVGVGARDFRLVENGRLSVAEARHAAIIICDYVLEHDLLEVVDVKCIDLLGMFGLLEVAKKDFVSTEYDGLIELTDFSELTTMQRRKRRAVLERRKKKAKA